MAYENLSNKELRDQTKAARKFLMQIVVTSKVHAIALGQIRDMEHELRIRRFVDWHNRASDALGEQRREESELRAALENSLKPKGE